VDNRVVFYQGDEELPIHHWPVDVIPRVADLINASAGQFRVLSVRHTMTDRRWDAPEVLTHVHVCPVNRDSRTSLDIVQNLRDFTALLEQKLLAELPVQAPAVAGSKRELCFYLDAVRDPRNYAETSDYSIARNLENAKRIILSHAPFPRWFLDYDLGDGETGLDFLKWAAENARDKWPKGCVVVHSTDSEGSLRMKSFLSQVEQCLLVDQPTPLDCSAPSTGSEINVQGVTFSRMPSLAPKRDGRFSQQVSGSYQHVHVEMWEQMKEELSARQEQIAELTAERNRLRSKLAMYKNFRSKFATRK